MTDTDDQTRLAESASPGDPNDEDEPLEAEWNRPVTWADARWVLFFAIDRLIHWQAHKRLDGVGWWPRFAYWTVATAALFFWELRKQKLELPAGERGWDWGTVRAVAFFSVCFGTAGALLMFLWDWAWSFSVVQVALGLLVVSGALVFLVWSLVDIRRQWAKSG